MGNPNVGKSVVFSRLTGIEVISSNYPGTTVEYTMGKTTIGGESSEVIDPPGVYSLEPSCRAEEVTAWSAQGLSQRLRPVRQWGVAQGPSRVSTISSRRISSAGRARAKPPCGPRCEVTSPCLARRWSALLRVSREAPICWASWAAETG